MPFGSERLAGAPGRSGQPHSGERVCAPLTSLRLQKALNSAWHREMLPVGHRPGCAVGAGHEDATEKAGSAMAGHLLPVCSDRCRGSGWVPPPPRSPLLGTRLLSRPVRLTAGQRAGHRQCFRRTTLPIDPQSSSRSRTTSSRTSEGTSTER